LSFPFWPIFHDSATFTLNSQHLTFKGGYCEDNDLGWIWLFKRL
jgi:hypothetical protein